MSRQRFAVMIVFLVFLVISVVVAIRYFANPLATPARPTVTIKAPPSNTKVTAGAEVKIEVAAEGGIIQRTELHLDNQHLTTAVNPTPNKSFTSQMVWKATGTGQHTLTVYAYTAEGVASEPAGIVVLVEVAQTITPSLNPTRSPLATATATATATQTITPIPATPSPTVPPTALPAQPSLAPPSPVPPPALPEPTPAPTEAPPPPPVPTEGLPPGCPGLPIIGDFAAIRSLIFPPDPKATLTWGPVQNATEIVIDQGIGPVTAPGSTVVQPTKDTTYTLTATGCGGKASKSVTVGAVLPPTPSPAATVATIVTSTLPGPALPLIPHVPATIIVPIPSTDLAISSITAFQIVGQATGNIMVGLTNSGPTVLTNLLVTVDCAAERTAYAGGQKTALALLSQHTLSLNVGQTNAVPAGMQVSELDKYWYRITCTAKANINDTNPGNNTRTVNIPQP